MTKKIEITPTKCDSILLEVLKGNSFLAPPVVLRTRASLSIRGALTNGRMFTMIVDRYTGEGQDSPQLTQRKPVSQWRDRLEIDFTECHLGTRRTVRPRPNPPSPSSTPSSQ